MKLILPDESEVTVGKPIKSLEEHLIEVGLDPLTVLISSDGTIIPEDTIPDEEDVIRVIRISHGG